MENAKEIIECAAIIYKFVGKFLFNRYSLVTKQNNNVKQNDSVLSNFKNLIKDNDNKDDLINSLKNYILVKELIDILIIMKEINDTNAVKNFKNELKNKLPVL